MRSRLLALGLIASVFLQSCILYFFRDTDLGGWEFVGPDYLDTVKATGVNIVEAGDGTVVVGYSASDDPDIFAGGEAHFVMIDGRRWREYAPSRVLSSAYDHIRVGFLDDGRLCYVSEYYDGSFDAWNGVVWESIPGPPGTDEYTHFRASTITPDGTMFVASRETISESESLFSVYRYAAGVWSLVGDASSIPAATDMWITVDGTGRCVVYQNNWSEETGDAPTVYRENGGTWDELPALPEWIMTPFQMLCLNAVAASGSNLYCAGYDTRTDPASPVVIELADTDWIVVGGTFGGSESSVHDVGLSQGGEPLVLVTDYSAYGELSAYRLTNGAWELLGISGFSSGDGPGEAALLSGSDNYLYVAYIALGHERRVSVMRRAPPL